MLLLMFYLPTQAEDIPEINIETQHKAQERCQKERAAQCVAMCKKSDDSNCALSCDEIAKNECRQAGE